MVSLQTLNAQPLKHVRQRDLFNEYVEEYDVLKSDKNIKHGAYQSIHISDKKPVIAGFYQNNFKDSTWLYTAINGDTISTGSYHLGERTGTWKNYHKNKPADAYDFSSKKLLYHQKTGDDEQEYAVATDHDTIYTHLDSAPFVLGGKNAITRSIARNIRYPAEARRNGDIGQVIVLFTVTAEGKITNCHPLRPRVASLDEAAVKTFLVSAGEWVPGTLNGKPVAVIESFPISFGMAVIR